MHSRVSLSHTHTQNAQTRQQTDTQLHTGWYSNSCFDLGGEHHNCAHDDKALVREGQQFGNADYLPYVCKESFNKAFGLHLKQ